MNSLYEKDNLLSYVQPDVEPVAPQKPSVFKPKENKNGLATAAFIVAMCSIVLGLLIVPSLLGIALGVGALIVAVKRSLPKKIPIISISVSVLTLVASVVGLIFASFQSVPEPDPYIPPAYTYDAYNGIAYKYNPVSNIPCDSDGSCVFEVSLFQIEPELCPKGGTFTPHLQDILSGFDLPLVEHSFPVLEEGKEHTLSLKYQGDSNGRLVTAPVTDPISCSR